MIKKVQESTRKYRKVHESTGKYRLSNNLFYDSSTKSRLLKKTRRTGLFWPNCNVLRAPMDHPMRHRDSDTCWLDDLLFTFVKKVHFHVIGGPVVVHNGNPTEKGSTKQTPVVEGNMASIVTYVHMWTGWSAACFLPEGLLSCHRSQWRDAQLGPMGKGSERQIALVYGNFSRYICICRYVSLLTSCLHCSRRFDFMSREPLVVHFWVSRKRFYRANASGWREIFQAN